jgi:hypothetical protein
MTMCREYTPERAAIQNTCSINQKEFWPGSGFGFTRIASGQRLFAQIAAFNSNVQGIYWDGGNSNESGYMATNLIPQVQEPKYTRETTGILISWIPIRFNPSD